MNELIKIHEHKGQKLVSARELHEFLGNRRKFSDWIKQRISQYDFIENNDYATFHKIVNRSKATEYALSMDMAKELCMVENNARGKEARRYFIEVEKNLKSLNPANLSKLQILQLALESEQKREALEKENKALKPKADFHDRVMKSEDLINIGQAAKVLQLPYGRNTLFKNLREMGIFFKNKNEPRQEFIDRGYFKMKEVSIETNNHGTIVKLQPLVTQKGLSWLCDKLNGSTSIKLANVG